MSVYRVQVSTHRLGELPIDWCVNTLYFRDTTIGPDIDKYRAVGDGARDAFVGGTTRRPTGFQIEAKVYDLADAKPRPVKHYAQAVNLMGTGGNPAPREVALCLSYYHERNLPRQRGRIYVGPWAASMVEERVGQPVLDEMDRIRVALQNIGGIDIDWSIHSTIANKTDKVTAGWIDNEWDTQRSRGLRATVRRTFTTGE